jgi:pyrroline-5-carboxylate reductase
MLRNEVNLGSVVEDLQRQMTISNDVCIVGSNTTGVAPMSTDECVLKAPTGIISYEPDELMISIFAGTSIADINTELQNASQRIVVLLFQGWCRQSADGKRRYSVGQGQS